MRSSVYDSGGSAVQINSLDLMKMINIPSNVKNTEPSKTNKITKVLTTPPCITNTQTPPSGRE